MSTSMTLEDAEYAVNAYEILKTGQKGSASVVKPRQTELTLPSSLAVEVGARSLRMLTRKPKIPK